MATTYLSPGVYVEEVPSASKPIEGVGTAVAAFVGFAERGEFNKPVLVTNWSQFKTNFGDFMAGSYLAHSVYGYFNNGGGSCYVVRIGGQGSATPAAVALPSRASASMDTIRVNSLASGSAGNDVTVEVSDAGGDGDDAAELFNLTVRRGSTVETFENLTMRRGGRGRYAETVVNETQTGSKLIQLIDAGAGGTLAERKPTAGTYTLTGGAEATTEITPAEYEGDVADRTGIGGLEAIEEITMVCVPDLSSALQKGLINDEQMRAVQTAIIGHCESMGDRMAILDAPPGLKPQEVKDWRVNVARYDSKYATLYYPWIKVSDPATNQIIEVPPCGHIAGIWARNDSARGVHKAPANETIRGAVDVEMQITKGEQDQLNPDGINCIRAFAGRGIRVWGARTLSSDPEWRYVNVRRFFNFVEKSIENGTHWVVFEPNDLDLWSRITRNVTAFLTTQWRIGALFGATPEQAFYVKCDEETNPGDVIDAGQVVTEIGICPVKPAEFVVFRIAQLPTGGAAIGE
ncbi:MAG TPA: phage tail sheath subtilisin-like domain-containing protein [Dehalococcoidia bacterium]